MAEPVNGHPVNAIGVSPEQCADGQAKGAKARASKLTDMVAQQDVLYKIVTGAVKQVQIKDQAYQVIDIPASQIAACANAWQRLEAQRRASLGRPDPKPIEVTKGKAKVKRHAPVNFTP